MVKGELESLADIVVFNVQKNIGESLAPYVKRTEKLELELAAAKSTIATLQQKMSASQRELAALTRRALRKSDAK